MNQLSRVRTKLLGTFVVLVAASWLPGVQASARLCSALCTENSNCYQPCLDIDAETCGQYGICGDWTPPDYCGDGFCATSHENCSNCPQDCGVCTSPIDVTRDNGICELGESKRTSPNDCPDHNPIVCGDGLCDSTENIDNCFNDCYEADNCKTPISGWSESHGEYRNDVTGDELCEDVYDFSYHCSSNRCRYTGVGAGGSAGQRCDNMLQCDPGQECVGLNMVSSPFGYCTPLP
jgi:hypothetical protein